MIPILVHNFKCPVKPIPKPKPTIPPKKPETEHWKKFDDIIHQILF